MSSANPERRVAEALRARATGGGQGWSGRPVGRTARPSALDQPRIGTALLLALLAGTLLGMGLALLSVLAPGVLPAVS
jgi:hypothetical protein